MLNLPTFIPPSEDDLFPGKYYGYLQELSQMPLKKPQLHPLQFIRNTQLCAKGVLI